MGFFVGAPEYTSSYNNLDNVDDEAENEALFVPIFFNVARSVVNN